MTGEPEDVPPLARVAMPDVEQHGYRAYPLVDHIADKVTAIIQRYGEREAPSTRFKDLVDLVAIVTEASVAAQRQVKALRSEAARSLLPIARTLHEAHAAVSPFTDPLLDGSAVGTWEPKLGRWVT